MHIYRVSDTACIVGIWIDAWQKSPDSYPVPCLFLGSKGKGLKRSMATLKLQPEAHLLWNQGEVQTLLTDATIGRTLGGNVKLIQTKKATGPQEECIVVFERPFTTIKKVAKYSSFISNSEEELGSPVLMQGTTLGGDVILTTMKRGDVIMVNIIAPRGMGLNKTFMYTFTGETILAQTWDEFFEQ